MEPRRAITAAAVVSLTLLAGAAGITLNSGIVGSEPDSNVGRLTPTDPATGPNTIHVDAVANDVPPPLAVQPGTSASRTSSSASRSTADRDDDRRQGEHHDEYQGADDDD
jgi:hypothetical protein